MTQIIGKPEQNMYIENLKDIEAKDVSGGEIKDVLKQVPIGPKQGWKDHTLRVFTIHPGGHTPKHSHNWEHVNYVISGTGTLEIDGEPRQMSRGTFAFVPPNKTHQYSNSGNEDFVMICIVPASGDY